MNPESSWHHQLISAADISLPLKASVREALRVIESSEAKIAFVVDAHGALQGSITDGDIRRSLLAGSMLDAPLATIMHKQPAHLPQSASKQEVLAAMQELGIQQIPLLDKNKNIFGVAVKARLTQDHVARRPNRVVIMAGGKGKRLMPMTEHTPKPMLEMAGKPLLEWIILRLAHYGFRNFTLAVNYLGQMIEEYFEDGSRFNCRIDYLREKEFLGTAGALSLLEEAPAEPIIVMNGDILTAVDFEAMLLHHEQSHACATICARSHQIEVPYGVIQQQDGQLTGMVEKPVYDNLISAGIYVLSPEAMQHIPKNQVIDMPAVMIGLVKKEKKVAIYLMQDNWIDIGRHDDLDRAKRYLATLD